MPIEVISKEKFEKTKAAMLKVDANDPFMSWMGLEIVEFEPDYIKGRIPVKNEIINNFGSVHGGVLYALADVVAGTLSCAMGYFSPTVNGHLNYLEPVMSKEYVYCEACIKRCGTNLVFADITITDDNGKVCDDGSFTFFRTKSAVIKEEK